MKITLKKKFHGILPVAYEEICFLATNLIRLYLATDEMTYLCFVSGFYHHNTQFTFIFIPSYSQLWVLSTKYME